MTKTQLHQSLSARTRKRAQIFVTLMASLLALFALAASARAFADGPTLTIGVTQRDFGDVYVGEVIEQVFTVRNDGTAPLELAEKSLTGQVSISRDLRAAVARPRRFNDALTFIALITRRAAPS